MNSFFLNLKHELAWQLPTRLVTAGFAVVLAAGDHADAASARNERTVASIKSRAADVPVMAIVSLRSQRITIYDADGWILRAPVSSGRKGRETPAGVFAVIQKEAEHHSNLYDDAYMPHMQRITWSGIALHGGPLPGYPASHGCIRMPYDFAAHLFDETKRGMRVIVTPTDVAPVEIAHPALFSPKPGARAAAAARAAEADEAASKADQARLMAAAASQDAARATLPLRAMEKLKLGAEAQVAAALRALASPGSHEAMEQAEATRAKAADNLAELETRVTAAKAELQPKLDAAASAREAAVKAETSRVAAVQAAREVARDLEPISMFISRKTQRLYVRQAFRPIMESAVTIQDVDRPIGTHVFTAVGRGDTDMRWTVVSLDSGHTESVIAEPRRPARGGSGRVAEPIPTDPSGAKAALDRIDIPQDALERIEELASPRSSLIVSDESLSSETGEGTDFVVIMSGEPQGGISFRRRSPKDVVRHRLPFSPSPSAGRGDPQLSLSATVAGEQVSLHIIPVSSNASPERISF